MTRAPALSSFVTRHDRLSRRRRVPAAPRPSNSYWKESAGPQRRGLSGCRSEATTSAVSTSAGATFRPNITNASFGRGTFEVLPRPYIPTSWSNPRRSGRSRAEPPILPSITFPAPTSINPVEKILRYTSQPARASWYHKSSCPLGRAGAPADRLLVPQPRRGPGQRCRSLMR